MVRKLLSAALAILAAAAFSQTRLSADDAVALALENNISLKQSEIGLKGKRRDKSNAWSAFFPSITGSLTYQNPNKSPEQQGVVTHDYTLSANLGFSLNVVSASFTGIRQARLAFEAGEISDEQARRQIELATRKLFASILFQREYAAAQEKNLGLVESQYEQARARYLAGRAPEIEMLSAQVKLENAKPNVLQTKIDVENSLMSFKQLLGISLDENIELEGSLLDVVGIGEIDFDALEGESLAVKSAKKAQEQAKFALFSERLSLFTPSLSLNWALAPSKLGGGDDYPGKNKDWKDGGAFSATLAIQLDKFFPWSQAFQKMKKAEDAQKQADLALESAKTDFAVKSSSCKNNILHSKQSLESLEANCDLADRNYEMTRIAYNAGSSDFLTLQSTIDAQLQSNVGRLSSALSLFNAILDYESEAGVPFGTILQNTPKKSAKIGAK